MKLRPGSYTRTKAYVFKKFDSTECLMISIYQVNDITNLISFSFLFLMEIYLTVPKGKKSLDRIGLRNKD